LIRLFGVKRIKRIAVSATQSPAHPPLDWVAEKKFEEMEAWKELAD